MKAERILLSFVAVIIGLAAAGGAFYLYQMTKALPNQKIKPPTLSSNITPSPTPDSANFLNVDSPKDEQVFDKKLITVHGKTANDATIIVSSENGDEVIKPASNGDFNLTITIPDGTSILQTTAIFANGEEKSVARTVTFSTENF